MRGCAADAFAASRLRSGCHGAAARRVSITLSLAPARNSPRSTPLGRPRVLDFCSAPALPEERLGRRPIDPARMAARMSGGIAA